MEQIAVIGIGPGRDACMTAEAAREIAQSEVVYAAARHAHLAGDRHAPLEPLGAAMEDMSVRRLAGARVAVLLSGDASLYSLLPALTRAFGAEALRVIPGVGALQSFCAALREPWQDAAVLSAHGRELSASALAHAVRTHARTFLFCDARHGPAWACDALARCGLGEIEIAVGERLSYPDEKITIDAAGALRGQDFDALSLARFHNPAPRKGIPPAGISDEAFLRGKVPMTKREIRALAVSEMRLSPDEIVWDIGAGTGSVSVECALRCPEGIVYAVERDTDALWLIAQNAEKFGVPNLEIVPGSAPASLTGLPAPTSVFLGGSGGEMAQILRLIERFPQPVRLVATAVTLESAWSLTRELKRWSRVEAAQIAVTRLEPVGDYHMFKAQNPVFLISADWEGTA